MLKLIMKKYTKNRINEHFFRMESEVKLFTRTSRASGKRSKEEMESKL